jgi:predicted GIY-YIG superfamily endonuclease
LNTGFLNIDTVDLQDTQASACLLNLVYVAIFGSRIEALSAERQNKRLDKSKEGGIISKSWQQLTILAKPKNNR